MRIRFPVLFAVILLFLASAGEAAACSCSGPFTVDKQFAMAKNVVVVKAVSFLAPPKGTGPREYVGGFNFKTQKVYKGAIKPGQEMVIVSAGMCSYSFKASGLGQDFLFYLDEDPSILPACVSAGTVESMAGDISYLDNLDRVRGLTRISGVVSQGFSTALEGEEEKGGPLEGHTVRLTGNGRDIRMKTDKDGLFEVYGLPPGQYRLEPEKIKGYHPTYSYTERSDVAAVTLFHKGHVEINFGFGIHNAISGRLVDAAGKPIDHVMLKLLPAAGKPRQYFNESAFSEKDGSFRFEDIPVGKYVIVGNPDNEISAEYPYPRFYSSGADDRQTAVEITIGPGEFLTGFTVKAPPAAETVIISGTLLFEDGTPVRSERVKFYTGATEADKSAPGDATAYTDKDGKFRLKVLKGQKGTVYASLYPNTWVYRACLDRVGAARTKAVDKSGRLETARLPLEAAGDSDGLELRFAFSLCN